MADLSQYSKDMTYLADKAKKGELTSKNEIYKKLKEKSKNLPDLKKWLANNIDSNVKQG